MGDRLQHIKDTAEQYWNLREQGVLGEERTIAHNALLDALTEAGIWYEDREHAAQIGRDVLHGHVSGLPQPEQTPWKSVSFNPTTSILTIHTWHNDEQETYAVHIDQSSPSLLNVIFSLTEQGWCTPQRLWDIVDCLKDICKDLTEQVEQASWRRQTMNDHAKRQEKHEAIISPPAPSHRGEVVKKLITTNTRAQQPSLRKKEQQKDTQQHTLFTEMETTR